MHTAVFSSASLCNSSAISRTLISSDLLALSLTFILHRTNSPNSSIVANVPKEAANTIDSIVPGAN